MFLNTLLQCSKNITKWAKDNAPATLIGIGITGLISAGVSAVAVTPKAMEAIEDHKNDIWEEIIDDPEIDDSLKPISSDDLILEKKEVVKAAWKFYAPSILLAAGSAGCIVKGYKIQNHKLSVMTTAYTLSETAFRNYKNKVKETLGEKKEAKIKKELAKDYYEEDNKKKQDGPTRRIINTGRGNMLFKETFTGQEFISDMNFVEQTVIEVNKRLLAGREEWVSVNEWFDILGLERSDLGDDYGWSPECMLNLDPVPIHNEYKDTMNEFPYITIISADHIPRYGFHYNM